MSTAADLCSFIDDSPSPFHAVAAMRARLDAAGFRAVDERDRWDLERGTAAYAVRDGGSIVAFRLGQDVGAGARLIGAHTDSPTYKVRPEPDVHRHGAALLGVEVYGGPLHHTWFDRDLTLAGRVVTDGGGEHLVHLPGAPLRIPSLAIHLDRSVATDGFKPNPQQHLLPVWQMLDGGRPALRETLADHVGCAAADIIGHDLVLADTQPSTLGGAGEVFVLAPRQDNLASCHAGLSALVAAAPADQTQLLVASDHEEVGSGSAEGARGSFLADVLARLAVALAPGEHDGLPRLLAASLLVSADTAHAVHPSYADRHDPGHRPLLGGGPVIKAHASQAYATDARTAAWFEGCCRDVDVPVQQFTNRADQPSGSTIGPLTATRIGVATVDVGTPLLSMHSIREQSAVVDAERMIAAMTRHLSR